MKQLATRECHSAAGKKDRSYLNHGANLPKTLNYDIQEETTIADRNNSPSKMRDEQRKKVFMQKKAQLLKTIELPET